jgi:NAD-dependent SIR2 family protein deacetylase
MSEDDKDELTYCVKCYENLEEDKFNYRFELPTCHECVIKLNLIPDIAEGGY